MISARQFASGAARWACLVMVLICVWGCHRDMRDQPRYEAFEASEFFPDGQIARLPVAGTVARGALNGSEVMRSGKGRGRFVTQVPIQIDRSVLERGQQRFQIYCSPCHARTGDGNGVIVQRGFPQPPSYHTERVRNLPAGHFFDVITHGLGVMPRFASQVSVRDRWAIVAYIRVLQLSQHAKVHDLPNDVRARLEAEPESQINQQSEADTRSGTGQSIPQRSNTQKTDAQNADAHAPDSKSEEKENSDTPKSKPDATGDQAEKAQTTAKEQP